VPQEDKEHLEVYRALVKVLLALTLPLIFRLAGSFPQDRMGPSPLPAVKAGREEQEDPVVIMEAAAVEVDISAHPSSIIWLLPQSLQRRAEKR
jgi:hypothetical protein